jgi:hypothetical protein
MQKQYLDQFEMQLDDCDLARELKASLKIVDCRIEDDLLYIENGDYQTIVNPISLGFKRDSFGWFCRNN